MLTTIKASDGTELDAGVVNLAKAIRARESKGNYNAVGDAGTSKGAYQWQPGNFENAATQYGLDPSDFSPVNQDKVAYHQVKALKDKGYSPEQVAAAWNAGEGALKNDVWKEYVGDKTINGENIHYDTPGYVNAVMQEFQKAKGTTGGFNPSPYSNPEGGAVSAPGQFDLTGATTAGAEAPKDESLGGHLASRVDDFSTAVNDTISRKINPLSGLIQTAGAAAGAIGDTVNAGLELIPGVKQAEEFVGKGVQAALGTQGGQQLAQSVGEFTEKHPEISKDIGAGVNIVTAIPSLKGLGIAKNIVGDAAAQTLKGAAEKSVQEGLTKTVASTITGRKALERSPDAIQTLIRERALPEVVDGKYTTKEAFHRLSADISHIEESELQPALEKANLPATSSRIPLKQYEESAIADAKNQLKDAVPIEKYFERLREKYGDYPTLQDMNEAKRLVARNISEAGFNSPTYSVDKIVRSTLQRSVEEGAKALGLDDVAEINDRMARLIKAQNILKSIEGKGVKTGLVGDVIRGGATAGGEALGGATGIPFAGAYTGYKAAGYAAKKFAEKDLGILKRTGKHAERTSLKEGVGKIKGLVGGALAQKASGS